MAITIKDIASLAGTSRGTVDRVFNNRGRVSQEMTERILAVAAQHNYIPNESAKLLATSQKSHTIGVVINSIGNRFFDDVLLGIERARAQLAKYKVSIRLVQLRGYSDTEQVATIDKLIDGGAHAIAITPIDSPLVRAKLAELADSNIPVAFINGDMAGADRLVAVAADNRENGQLAGNIAVMTLPANSRVAVVTGSYSHASHNKRVEAFSRTIQESDKGIAIVDVAECRDDNQLSYKAVQSILANNRQLDLIYICAGGVTGGLQAVVDSNRAVSVITVDDNDMIRQQLASGVVIATITQDPVRQGSKPLEVLAEHLVFGRVPASSKIYTENRIRLAKSKW